MPPIDRVVQRGSTEVVKLIHLISRLDKRSHQRNIAISGRTMQALCLEPVVANICHCGHLALCRSSDQSCNDQLAMSSFTGRIAPAGGNEKKSKREERKRQAGEEKPPVPPQPVRVDAPGGA